MELAKPVVPVPDLNPKLTIRVIGDDENKDGEKNAGKRVKKRADSAKSRDDIPAKDEL